MTEIKITPLRSRIIVRLEGTTNGKLSEIVSDGGIVIAGANLGTGINSEDGLADRWAEVLATGNEVKDVKQGDRVLIQSGKWSEAAKVGNEFFWMSEEQYVILIDDKFLASGGKEKTHAPVVSS